MKSLKQFIAVSKLARKHNLSKREIIKAIKVGSKVEKEHTNSNTVAKTIASHHIDERPDYYKRLKKVE